MLPNKKVSNESRLMPHRTVIVYMRQNGYSYKIIQEHLKQNHGFDTTISAISEFVKREAKKTTKKDKYSSQIILTPKELEQIQSELLEQSVPSVPNEQNLIITGNRVPDSTQAETEKNQPTVISPLIQASSQVPESAPLQTAKISYQPATTSPTDWKSKVNRVEFQEMGTKLPNTLTPEEDAISTHEVNTKEAQLKKKRRHDVLDMKLKKKEITEEEAQEEKEKADYEYEIALRNIEKKFKDDMYKIKNEKQKEQQQNS
jgi:hypothetical protein